MDGVPFTAHEHIPRLFPLESSAFKYMNPQSNRRGFLSGVGVAGMSALAGCTELRSSQSEEPAESGVMAFVEPDEEAQQEVAELQEELITKVQDDELSEQEAMAELQSLQAELTAGAVESVESYAEDVDITVEDTVPEVGALLLEGSDGALIEALSNEAVDGLLPGSRFAELQAQQDAAGGEPAPDSEP